MAARRMLKGRDLGAYLGQDEMWISRRMRGKVAWTGGELVKLAALFDCEPADLLPRVDPDLRGPGAVRRQGLEPRTRWLRVASAVDMGTRRPAVMVDQDALGVALAS